MDLKPIRERANAATPGPWDDTPSGVYAHAKATYILLKQEPSSTEDLANCTFIAHARQDIYLLMEEVERLRSELSHEEDVDEGEPEEFEEPTDDESTDTETFWALIKVWFTELLKWITYGIILHLGWDIFGFIVGG